MEFSMEFHGIQWNSMEFYETKVDGIPIPWKIPWNSMEFRQLTEFDGIRFRQGCFVPRVRIEPHTI
jgi:hypothetical protein